MNGSEWMDLTVLERKKYNFLGEVEDLTHQLAQAVDSAGKARRESLSGEDRERISALLKGGEPHSNEERVFQEQAQKARRLLERVVELDRRVSFRMAGENSFYKKNK